jgi:hypothetical protein
VRLLAALLLVWLLVCARAQARVERFALVVGNNLGVAGEVPLRFAESDAARVYEVLTRLGDFSALNSVLLRGQDANALHAALLAMNERVRDAVAQPDTQAVLAIYYSGHADAETLHLAGSEFPLAELRQLARGSAANFRLVVLDACRSGALTRVKGGERVPPFALNPAPPDPAPGDGFAFLTASSAHEDAQESDELQGAFFSHAFVSGLLGAADANADGAVVLNEVYRYAYEATLRSTSRTWAGTQHPTFHYDLRGRGELVLTRPLAHAAERAHFEFPPGLGFMLMRGSADGPVAAELERAGTSRTLSMEPGRYFVRARAPDVMYEGYVEAASGTSRAIELRELKRIDYAQLVRRRGSELERAHSLDAGLSIRSELPNSQGACFGGFAGYALDWNGFGLRTRFSACAAGLSNELVTTDVTAYDLAAYFYRAWDLAWLTLDLGAGAGLSVFHQRFQTAGVAPDRASAVPFVSLNSGAQANLPHGFFTGVTIGAETHFMRVSGLAGEDAELEIGFAARGTVGAGKRF